MSFKKRAVLVNGRKTSVSLEDEFWDAVRDLAAARKISILALVSEVQEMRLGTNLSSSIRLFVLDHYRSQDLASRGEADLARRPEDH